MHIKKKMLTRWLSSGICCVVWYVSASISEGLIASIITLMVAAAKLL
jgi:hypothetical protein